MIVWGGYVCHVGDVNTGGRYNPITDNWTVYQHDQCALWPRSSHGSVDGQ